MAKVGRPRKTSKELPLNWQATVVNMASKGASEVEIRAALIKSNGMTYTAIRDLWYALKERETEFSETLLIAKVLCEAWWVEKGQKKLNSQYFQGYTWLANMKNRFGWRDKTEIEHNVPDKLLDKFKDLDARGLINKIHALIGNQT
jgi:hypothetical protein